MKQSTIVAPATALISSAIGIIRLSGENALSIHQKIAKTTLKPNIATYCKLYENNKVIDDVIAIYFQSPKSFTGEDVIEWQTHGSIIVMKKLISLAILCGAKLAINGEFSQRAFLNGKLDLTQAEAIMQIIAAKNDNQLFAARNSLRGDFSNLINNLYQKLVNLHVYLEASIDFSEEEIDFLNLKQIKQKIINLKQETEKILSRAINSYNATKDKKILITGLPNVGKSSLFNCIADQQVAIVTDIAGTTRDILSYNTEIKGININILDTAGLRESNDKIEQIGIKLAIKQYKEAELIIWVHDLKNNSFNNLKQNINKYVSKQDLKKLLIVANKIDLITNLTKLESIEISGQDIPIFYISSKNKQINDLTDYISKLIEKESQDIDFIASLRSIEALQNCLTNIDFAQQNIANNNYLELIAEDLKQALNNLSEITGKLVTEELLGKIFSKFCIGK